MLLTLLSGLFGGILRLAPEVLKFLDAKNDRQHELDMCDKQYAFQQLTGQQKRDEMIVDANMQTQKAQFDAYAAAFASQANMAAGGGKFSAFVSALVRPYVTVFIFTMWAAHKIAIVVYAWRISGDAVQVLTNCWTEDDTSMLTMVVAFWFCGRVIDKRQV